MDAFFLTLYGLSLLLITLSVFFGRLRIKLLTRYRSGLPPGPNGSLLIGAKGLISGPEPWKTYAQWSKEYESPLVSYRIYPTTPYTIVLNSANAVHELLNKRSTIYSDRPNSWMFHELCGRGLSIFNISSRNQRHRQYRKMLQDELRPREYQALLEDEVDELVEGLCIGGEHFESYIRRSAASTILKMTYGYSMQKKDDPFVGVADEAAKISGWALAPGRWLVDYFPIVRFIPFTTANRQAAVWRKRLEWMSAIPHEWVKDQMKTASHTESFTSRRLQKCTTPEEDDVVKWCAGGLYAGGTDTIVSAMISFVLLMALHPKVQSLAHEEVKFKCGGNAPRANDLDQLPYLKAILKEVLRFAPVANLALPHKVTQDDEYLGYHIPKDSAVIANVWAIMHDPEMYSDPFSFDPSRFLLPRNDPDPRTYAFGFGRRSCPGSQFGEMSVLLGMANIVHKFDISLPQSEWNTAKVEFTAGITSHVKPFPVDIRSRES